jgi:hypothetical protein
MKLSTLFSRCLAADYSHTEGGGDYAIEKSGDTLYLYFEASDGWEDWRSNIAFPAKPYQRMGKTVWLAHGGFLKVWQGILPHVAPLLADPSAARIVTVGYSHGGALAALAHEYVWYHRPDIRHTILGYGFGAPRVLWGIYTKALRERFERFTVVRNTDDAVTHLPPALLGYFHVGKMLKIGEKGKYSSTDAHRPENILRELLLRERP